MDWQSSRIVQVMYGGYNSQRDIASLRKQVPDVLVRSQIFFSDG
jgi:hypothetical protein